MQDNIYSVKSLLGKKGTKVQVEWLGFPKEEATWEPIKNLPVTVIKYYLDDPRRFGNSLPNPKIKYSKPAGKGA